MSSIAAMPTIPEVDGQHRLLIDDCIDVTPQEQAKITAYFQGHAPEFSQGENPEGIEGMRERFYRDVVSKRRYGGNFFNYLRTIIGILQYTANTLANGETYLDRRLSSRQMMLIVDILSWTTEEFPEGKVKICAFPSEICKLSGDCEHNCNFYHLDETNIRLIVVIINGILIGLGPR